MLSSRNAKSITSQAQWTWTWTGANSKRQKSTEEPGVLQSMESQRVRHYWATEQQDSTSLVCWWGLETCSRSSLWNALSDPRAMLTGGSWRIKGVGKKKKGLLGNWGWKWHWPKTWSTSGWERIEFLMGPWPLESRGYTFHVSPLRGWDRKTLTASPRPPLRLDNLCVPPQKLLRSSLLWIWTSQSFTPPHSELGFRECVP